MNYAPVSRSIARRIYIMLVFSLLISFVACSSESPPDTPPSPPEIENLLPGQQIWKDGVSSYLFGTNDTYEWSERNIQNQPEIQQALRDAGFTLMRSFFPDNASDEEIEQRIRTIENSGAQCLGVITNINNTTFNEHLVRYLGDRCLMYEFGNEPDYDGSEYYIPLEEYLSRWNSQIPRLRAINPDAVFIGPVAFTYRDDHKDYLRGYLEGVKASNVLPEAISFHLYPCYEDTRERCLQVASSYKEAAESVRALVKEVLGKELPVGITEWNYDPGNPPPAYGDEEDFMTQFSIDALKAMIAGGVSFACQFDAASYSGYGRLDMFDVENNQPKPQFYAIKSVIDQYRPDNIVTPTPQTNDNPVSSPYVQMVSREKNVACVRNTDGAGGSAALVDGLYGNWGFWGTDIQKLPDSCAIQVGKGPARLLLVWQSAYEFDYISEKGMTPRDYTIATSADSTNGVDGSWDTVVTVTDNEARVREHLIDFANKSWVKMTVTAGQAEPSQPYIRIDEIDLFDVTKTLDQTFFFSGDSVTGMAYTRWEDNQPSFPELFYQANDQCFPAMLNGGMGGWNSEGAVEQMDAWLALNPDIHYWLLGWGTNDAMQGVSPETYRANMQVLIDKIKQAGHIPVLSSVPYINNGNDDVDQLVRAYNDQIAQLTTANDLIPGPDLYKVVRDQAKNFLLEDGIHPSPAGGIAMSKAWFDALYKHVMP